MRLVLCDDNRILCEALAVALEARGHQVLAIATESTAGIEEVDRHRPDACLLDLRFPEPPDGLGAAREIRDRCPETAILVLSCAVASWSAIFARPSAVANRGIVVVVLNESPAFSTVSVLTSAQPRSAIVRTTSPSSSNPCSMESMPAAAPTRAPDSRVEWAVTFAPRA